MDYLSRITLAEALTREAVVEGMNEGRPLLLFDFLMSPCADVPALSGYTDLKLHGVERVWHVVVTTPRPHQSPMGGRALNLFDKSMQQALRGLMGRFEVVLSASIDETMAVLFKMVPEREQHDPEAFLRRQLVAEAERIAHQATAVTAFIAGFFQSDTSTISSSTLVPDNGTVVYKNHNRGRSLARSYAQYRPIG